MYLHIYKKQIFNYTLSTMIPAFELPWSYQDDKIHIIRICTSYLLTLSNIDENIGQRYLWQCISGYHECASWFMAPLMKFHYWFCLQFEWQIYYLVVTRARLSNQSTVRHASCMASCNALRVFRNVEDCQWMSYKIAKQDIPLFSLP